MDLPKETAIRKILDDAAASIKQGNISEGKAGLTLVLEREPDNVLAWLWMSRCVSTHRAKLECYERVLSVDPGNEHALKGVSILGDANGDINKGARRKRPTWIIVVLIAVIGAGIAAGLWLLGNSGKSSASTSPMPASCKGEICINGMYLSTGSDGANILVEFNLVNPEGGVEFGSEPMFQGPITVGLYRSEDDEFLYAASIPSGAYVCYSGNDIPWSDGSLASSCGFPVPSNQMQYSVKPGEEITVEVIEYDFVGTASLEK